MSLSVVNGQLCGEENASRVERGDRMEEKTIYYISEAAKKVQVESHVLRYWEDELKLPIKRNEMGHRYYTEQDVKQLQEIKTLKEQGLQLKAIRTVLFRSPGILKGIVADDAESDQNESSAASAGQTDALQTPAKSSEAVEALQVPADREAASGKEADMTFEKTMQEPVEQSIQKMPEKYTAKWTDTRMQALNMSADGKEAGKPGNKTGIGKDRLMDMVKERVEERAEEMLMNKPHRYVVALGDEKTDVAMDEEKSRKAARLQYLLQHMITEAVKSANRELCTEVKDSILKELDYQFRMQEERDDERWKIEEEHYRKIDEMIRERHKPREKLGRGRKKS